MEPLITIIIPVVREDKAKRCVEAINKNAHVPEELYIIKTERDVDGIGCPKMVEKMVSEVKTSLVMFLGDDTVPMPGFLSEVMTIVEEEFVNVPNQRDFRLRETPLLIGLNDGSSNGGVFATHWLASMALRRLLPDGQFFNTAYQHCFCDYELTDHAKEHDCYIFAEKAVIFHDHPQFKGGHGQDKYYEKVYADDVYMRDREIFWRRKRARLTNGDLRDRIAIAEPNISGDVCREYHSSFLMMNKPENFFYLIPDTDATDFEDWAHVRNNIVMQAMNEGCTALFMLDTDQEYERNVLMKLLHSPMWEMPDTAMVGALVFRRHKPYGPVIRRGDDPDHYVEPPEEEYNSGKIIEVDGMGTGCVLIKTEIFLDSQAIYPWFKEIHTGLGRRVSEDFNFCFKLRRMGFRIYCDTSTEITHWTRMGVNRYTHKIIKSFTAKKFGVERG